MVTANPKSPLSVLLPYQSRWVHDAARFKIGCFARQTGKSFATACEATRNCIANPRSTWVVLSSGERQALEFMSKVADWAEAFRMSLAEYEETRTSSKALLRSAEITWPNKSRVIALPANPKTARGYSGHLVLDEFAFHDDPTGIWRAVYPMISNPLRGVKSIRILSTPNGRSNKFSDLWHSPGDTYSKHRITLSDAIAEGLPVDAVALREGLCDPEGWAQEYECEFADKSTTLLPYETIVSCEHADATDSVPMEFWTRLSGPPIVLGVDFGRKRDRTVCWALEIQPGGKSITREVLVLDKISTVIQEQILRSRVAKAARVCLDYTGPGIGLGDFVAHQFGEWDPAQNKTGKVELCTITPSLNATLYPALKGALEKRNVTIPEAPEIREDLHSMEKVYTSAGSISYRARHTDDGHADRTSALALAIRATTTHRTGFAAKAIVVIKTHCIHAAHGVASEGHENANHHRTERTAVCCGAQRALRHYARRHHHRPRWIQFRFSQGRRTHLGNHRTA